jgi:NAD(P)-dependent dehydrogenase (short-subunit alcohol dehydrogenase family)
VSDDRAALVTGGASGIGAAAARALSARGIRVAIADLDAEAGERVAAEVGGSYVRVDVRRLDDLTAAVATVEDRYGRLDIAHLNAGIGGGLGVGDDFDTDRYRALVGVNLDGVVFGVHAALPALRRAGGGTVIATASLSGLTAFPADPLYAATKHAVVGLVRSLAEPLSADRIRIHALCPGFTGTPLVTPLLPALRAQALPLISVEDVAATLLAALDSLDSGLAWVVQPGRTGTPYAFRGVPGPRTAAGAT